MGDLDFRRIFQASPGLYLVLTPDLQIVAVSDAYCNATMTVREQIVGRGLFEIFPDNPADQDASGVDNLGASLHRVRAQLVADAMPVQKYDVRRPASEGGAFEERFWSPLNSPVLDAEGQLLYIIHRVEDVTEFMRLKQRGAEQERHTDALRARAERMEAEVYAGNEQVAQANRELKRMNVELTRMFEKSRELDRLKTEFFANVSHELRTPLALIIGPCQQLLASAALPAESARDVEVMLGNARLLLKHVTDILDISRLEAGRASIRYAAIDAGRLLRVAVGNFESLARERGVHLSVTADDGLEAEVDPEKLQRVVLNLLSNAFKFTPRGGRIRCTAGRDGVSPKLVVTVGDSGPGILPEHRELVFERFRQVEGGAARRHGGTGLGLAIAREFVDLHGGTIEITDAPEGGALFTVALPLRAPEGVEVLGDVAEATSLAEAAREALEEFKTRGEPAADPGPTDRDDRPLVLVVEDNPDMNRFVRELLGASYRTAAAMDGMRGLASLIELRPDVVVSDLMMPGMTGDALVREIRARPELQSTPILLLTAKADEEARIQLLKEGADDYLTKPFAPEELHARVRNLVERRMAQEHARRLRDDLAARNERLLSVAAQFEASNKELEAFSYTVSHDLRAPLRAIGGFGRLLSDSAHAKLAPEERVLLRRVIAATQRMASLVDDLLQFSRIVRAPLLDQPLDLAEVARDVVAELRQGEPDRHVDVHIPPRMPARGDRHLLRVVLDNLLGNAWKFTRPREHAVIEVGTGRGRGRRAWFVRDNGVGFDMEYAHKLFAPFERLHGSEFEGTGVGLATVERIVRRHRGDVWAESEPGKGATIWFTLEAPEPAGPR